MGFWKSERGINGDSWADEMGRCREALSGMRAEMMRSDGEVYHFDGNEGHEITMQEFADLVEFSTRGHLIVEVRHEQDAERPLSQLHDKGVETYPNRGQIHCTDDSRKEPCEA